MSGETVDERCVRAPDDIPVSLVLQNKDHDMPGWHRTFRLDRDGGKNSFNEHQYEKEVRNSCGNARKQDNLHPYLAQETPAWMPERNAPSPFLFEVLSTSSLPLASLAAKAERKRIPSCQLPGSSRGLIRLLQDQAMNLEECSSKQALRACPALRMFFAAFASAGSSCPQETQRKAVWSGRFSTAM